MKKGFIQLEALSYCLGWILVELRPQVMPEGEQNRPGGKRRERHGITWFDRARSPPTGPIDGS